MGKLTPQRMVILSFLSAILIGTLVLCLPMATQKSGSLSFIDSLFTATSATCVTGLVVKDTGTFFTPFGQWVIFILFQAGGLGIMTYSTLFAILMGRKIGLMQGDVVRKTISGTNIHGLKKLMAYIVGITLAVEAIGASALFIRWRFITDWTFQETLKRSVFHSVSAFCNAGFALFSNSMKQFSDDPFINITMILLIVLGGIGFVVIIDLLKILSGKNKIKKLSFHTKVVLCSTAALIAGGALIIFLCENSNFMQGMSLPGKIWTSLFQSVTARTAGFNTLTIGDMTEASLLAIIFLMFIGASPGSTGGGIKTSTFVVIIAAMRQMFTNNDRVMIMNRSVSKNVIRESFLIFFLSASWIFIVVLFMDYLSFILHEDFSFMQILFEVFSAFGTVGLSTGITGGLDPASKLFIILTMFAGRIGPLTLALAVAFRKGKGNYIFPEENIMVG